MKTWLYISISVVLATLSCSAQDGAPKETRHETRYGVAVIDDATAYADINVHAPSVLNQVLIEPNFSAHFHNRYSFSSSLIGSTTTYSDSATRLRVRETYAGVSAGNFDFTAGRKLVRWGTGYAFTAAGVLDPPRFATDPSDRLNIHQGRDMLKADFVHGPHAFTLAWSTAALTATSANMRDTTAFRYNVLVRGFDTALIVGNDRGGDSFGAVTFTRVLGQAWELHGEAAWREHAAILLGAKVTTHSGVTFIGEFFTPPNIPYYRSAALSPLAGRQHYAFVNASKTRLRERPGWKEWDLSGSIVANLDDRSYTGVIDVNRWFGKHFSSYIHAELPAGSKLSEYGSTPYSAATSIGVRFQL